MGKSGGDDSDGVQGRENGGGSNVADGGTDTKMEGGVQGDWIDIGYLEGHGGEVRRPLELRLSGSRRRELRCTAKCHPRGTISR